MIRRRLIVALSMTFCILAFVIGYMARPVDDLAGILRFHPVIKKTQSVPGASIRLGRTKPITVTEYSFYGPSSEVERAIPGKSTFHMRTLAYPSAIAFSIKVLPDGRSCRIVQFTPPLRGCTCRVSVGEDTLPWYEKAWRVLKHRFTGV